MPFTGASVMFNLVLRGIYRKYNKIYIKRSYYYMFTYTNTKREFAIELISMNVKTMHNYVYILIRKLCQSIVGQCLHVK